MFTVLAALAALSFSASGYFMKVSQGLTVRGPAAAMFGLVMLGAGCRRSPCATRR